MTEYEKYVERFCQNFEDGMKQVGMDDKSKCGFIFLFVRDNKPGCIDRASNMTDDSIVNILEDVLTEMKKNND